MSHPSIPKLAASSPISPLKSKTDFRNELLRSGVNWPQDVKYLRDTYTDIYMLWGTLTAPEQDKSLFDQTVPKLQELLAGLEAVAKEIPETKFVHQDSHKAKHDFEVARMYANTGDYAMAVVYQSYCIVKVHKVLTLLTQLGSRKLSSFMRKKGYGYDTSGEIQEGSGSNADQKNINDTANPQDQHSTPSNPLNAMRDVEAEQQFPELKKKPNIFPPLRTR
jgi:hypothetical protein